MSNELMSVGEQMVWAAVFAEVYKEMRKPPSHVCGSTAGKSREEWEQAVVIHAVEDAWAAVQYLRESPKGVLEGFGEDSNVYLFLQQTLGTKSLI